MKSLQSLPVFVRVSIFLLPLLAVALLGGAAMPANGDGEGQLVASPVDDCEGDKVCVEWEYYTATGYQTSGEPCCVDPGMVGSTQYQFCDSAFRHEH